MTAPVYPIVSTGTNRAAAKFYTPYFLQLLFSSQTLQRKYQMHGIRIHFSVVNRWSFDTPGKYDKLMLAPTVPILLLHFFLPTRVWLSALPKHISPGNEAAGATGLLTVNFLIDFGHFPGVIWYSQLSGSCPCVYSTNEWSPGWWCRWLQEAIWAAAIETRLPI